MANVATRLRDEGGIVERIRVHSPKSFLSNALMSCSRENSGTASGVMVAGVNPQGENAALPIAEALNVGDVEPSYVLMSREVCHLPSPPYV